MKKYYILFVAIFFLTLPLIARAAVLSLDPEALQVVPGDTVIFKIKIDNEKECVNAIESGLKFSKDTLSFKDFAIGESMISMWIDKPTGADIESVNTAGEFKFTGGIPGGYCGKIPGDPGDSDMLGEAVFEVKKDAIGSRETQSAQIDFLDNSQILLNDGFGTAAKISLKSASLMISDRSSVNNSDWPDRLKNDKIPPENFVVELTRDPSLFEGQNYIIFSTTDKQTGLDHYAVREIKMLARAKWWENILDKIIKPKESKWQTAVMPYLLEDQSLRSTVQVKAIDKAGNETLVEYIPPQPASASGQTLFNTAHVLEIFAALLFMSLLIVLFKKLRRKKIS